MVKNRELAEWLGLTYADILVYLSIGAALAMFFVQHAGFDILLAVTAITFALIACPIGMKRNSQFSNFTNTVKLISYPLFVLLVALLISFHYIVLATLSSYIGPVKAYYIASLSMHPTLQVNDRIFVDQGAYQSQTPQRGEIVVFHQTEELREQLEELTSQEFTGASFLYRIYRIIGLPNDLVEVRDGRTLINQKPIEEAYIAEPPSYQYGPVVIPANSYFVLGDNRNHAFDSKDWGFVPRANLVGKVNLIWWPPNRYGSPYEKN